MKYLHAGRSTLRLSRGSELYGQMLCREQVTIIHHFLLNEMDLAMKAIQSATTSPRPSALNAGSTTSLMNVGEV